MAVCRALCAARRQERGARVRPCDRGGHVGHRFAVFAAARGGRGGRGSGAGDARWEQELASGDAWEGEASRSIDGNREAGDGQSTFPASTSRWTEREKHARNHSAARMFAASRCACLTGCGGSRCPSRFIFILCPPCLFLRLALSSVPSASVTVPMIRTP